MVPREGPEDTWLMFRMIRNLQRTHRQFAIAEILELHILVAAHHVGIRDDISFAVYFDDKAGTPSFVTFHDHHGLQGICREREMAAIRSVQIER